MESQKQLNQQQIPISNCSSNSINAVFGGKWESSKRNAITKEICTLAKKRKRKRSKEPFLKIGKEWAIIVIIPTDRKYFRPSKKKKKNFL